MCTRLYRVCLLEEITGAFGKEELGNISRAPCLILLSSALISGLLLYREHWNLLLAAFGREGNSTHQQAVPPAHISHALSCWLKSLKYFTSFMKLSIRQD